MKPLLTWEVKIHADGPRDPEVVKRLEVGGPAGHTLLAIAKICADNGAVAFTFHGYDAREAVGVPKPLASHEIFTSWLMFAAQLAELPDLDPGRRHFAAHVFEAFWKLVEAPGEPELDDSPAPKKGPVH